MTVRDLLDELSTIYLEKGFKTVPPDMAEEYNWERQNMGGYPPIQQNAADFNDRNQNIRAREIGELLHENGGFNMMQQVAHFLQEKLGSKPANELSRCWNGIGSWVD